MELHFYESQTSMNYSREEFKCKLNYHACMLHYLLDSLRVQLVNAMNSNSFGSLSAAL